MPNSLSSAYGSFIDAAACIDPVFPPLANLLVPAPNLGNAPKFSLSISFGPPNALTVFLFNTYSPSSSNAGLTSPVLPASLIYIPAWARMTPPFCFPAAKPIPLTIWLAICWNIAFWIVFKNPPATSNNALPRSSVLFIAASIAPTKPSLNAFTVVPPNLSSKVWTSVLISPRAFDTPVPNLPRFALSSAACFSLSVSFANFVWIERLAVSISPISFFWATIFSSRPANSLFSCILNPSNSFCINKLFFWPSNDSRIFFSSEDLSFKYLIGSFIVDKSTLLKAPPWTLRFCSSFLATCISNCLLYISLDALLEA